MKRIFLVLFFTFLFTISSLPFARNISAQDSGWVIDSFDSAIQIQSSGVVSVDEKIAVDFRGLSKHGIYRDLPYVYLNEDGTKKYTELQIQKVLQDGVSGKYEVSHNDNNLEIKIGDGNRTLSGKHSYEIVYTAKGVLQTFSDHDELNWNVTGNDWAVHILSATAVISSEKGGLLRVACFQGLSGSTTPCTGALHNNSLANFTINGFLGSSEGMTIVAGFEKGLYPILTVERPKTFFEKLFAPDSFLLLGTFSLLAVCTVFLLWYKRGRDGLYLRNSVLDTPKGERMKGLGEHETIVVEYEPPEKLRPGEIGVLTDERADTLDVVATIIDLAARGYMTINEVPKKWMFGSTDYLLSKKKEADDSLVPYEKLLFDQLFGGKKEVSVSSLKRTFYSDLSAVKKALYDRVIALKLFPGSPESMRGTYIGLGVLFLIGGIFGTIWTADLSIYIADFTIGLCVFGIGLFVIAPFMSKRTAYGREIYRRIKGYQLFISSAEKYRQRFFEKKNLFNEVLPYAIVFGLTEKFATAMKDIGLPEKQMGYGWYYGVHAFNYASFNSSMNSFSSSLSSAIATAPKSSGFSSGGGFSGGGFGGGGGGSW